MGGHSTVFQAEVEAIGQAAEMAEELITMQGLSYDRLIIHVDSQAALMALDKLKVESLTVEKTIDRLNSLGRHIKIELKWVKAHNGLTGNELADKLAKEGSHMPPDENFPVSAQAQKKR